MEYLALALLTAIVVQLLLCLFLFALIISEQRDQRQRELKYLDLEPPTLESGEKRSPQTP